ncbi:MAG: hypothetical protein DLM71_01695 [Chloroflexi bacterium]|nr:MAG: hypothetical protein DLM71_01695 [Chloroflexota bacterium]
MTARSAVTDGEAASGGTPITGAVAVSNGIGRLGHSRWLLGLGVGSALVLAPWAAAPLRRLSSPFALLVVLPPLTLALEAMGWRELAASRLSAIGRPLRRLVATYVIWLATSAVLTLDVAAVAAASVGISVGRSAEERRWQLGGAILGANVGSLLFPFSNLTNLVLVASSGMGLATYVAFAAAPQVAAALVVGLLLVARARGSLTELPVPAAGADLRPAAAARPSMGSAGLLAGAAALMGAAGAIWLGLIGGDMAVPFAVSAGLVAGPAVAAGRIPVRALLRAAPLAGLGIVAGAAIAAGPIRQLAGLMPHPAAGVAGLALAVAVGGGLAAAVNNLPAALFGAAWLAGGPVGPMIAFLVGTNIGAIATPHGSVATMLVRGVGARRGVELSMGSYLGSAWRYAAAGALAAIAALAVSLTVAGR